jgi:DNA-directed RNA polymerase subunit RPC12/RpoP
MAESESQTRLRCPACGSRDIRRSFPKPFLDALMSVFKLQPLRCRSCRHRFYRWVRPEDRLAVGENEPHSQY